jgi:hypothetical protein
VKISRITQERDGLFHGEHHAASDGAAKAEGGHVGEGGAAGDDEARFAW